MNIEYVKEHETDIAAVSGDAAEVTTVQAAFFGDYSHYTSKPLRDFIYESNNGKHFFFTASREEALERLAQAN